MSQQKQWRKDNMSSFLLSGSHIVLSSSAPPWASRATLDTPDKSRKEISRHKSSLCNAVKFHWFSFLRIFDRQHKIVALSHVKQGLGDHVGSASSARFLGENVSWTRRCGETLALNLRATKKQLWTSARLVSSFVAVLTQLLIIPGQKAAWRWSRGLLLLCNLSIQLDCLNVKSHSSILPCSNRERFQSPLGLHNQSTSFRWLQNQEVTAASYFWKPHMDGEEIQKAAVS